MTKIYPPKYLETGMANNEPTFPQGYEIVEIEADDSSYYQDSYQNSTFIELHFKLDHYYDFKKYSRLEHHLYIKVGLGGSLSRKDNIVTLEEPTFTKYSETHYEYTLKFYNAWREKYRRKFVKDPQTKSVTFSLTGTELQHLECVIRSVVDWDINDDNILKIYLGQFSGTAYRSNYAGASTYNASPFWQASSDLKTISYDSITCADALKQLSELYGHAYNYNFELLDYFYIPNGGGIPWVDESGRYGIRLYSDTAENSTALMYGKNNGLKSIKATGAQDIVGVLHVVGSEKNIITYGTNDYESDVLHMPVAVDHNINGGSFMCRAILLYNGVDFLPVSGVYRERYDNYSVPAGYVEYVASKNGTAVMKLGTMNGFEREETASFPDIYPSRVGTVSGVTTDYLGYYVVADSALNFNYTALSEQTMKIIFQDGALAGMEFPVRYGTVVEEVWSNSNTENQTFRPTIGQNMPYTYSRTVGSFSLNQSVDVEFNFYPYFNLGPTIDFGNNASFSARCYLKKGSSTIFSESLNYEWRLHTTSQGSKPNGAKSTGETIVRTESLTSGDYEIVIELVFDVDYPVLSDYSTNIKTYASGYARMCTKNFTIGRNEIGGVDVPNATLHPAVGDHYVIVNCEMPASYIGAAELKLFKEAVKQLAEYQADGTTYSVEVNSKFMNNNDTINQGLSSGLCLKIQDSSFMTPARTFRIVNVKRPYNNENSPTIEISNVKRKKSRIDGFTHSIIDLGVAVANNNEMIAASNANLKSTKRQLQSSIEDVGFNQSVLELDQKDIKDTQAQMEKRIGNNEYQIQELWKAIK